MSLKYKDMGWARIRSDLQELAGSHVKVGVQAGTERDPDPAASGKQASMLTIAVAHEFGVPDKGIPERAPLRTTFDEQRPKLKAQIDAEYNAVLAGRKTVGQSLDAIGHEHAADVQARIRAGLPPPNSQDTIKRKGSSTPLVDSGQFVQSIRHVVVISKGRKVVSSAPIQVSG